MYDIFFFFGEFITKRMKSWHENYTCPNQNRNCLQLKIYIISFNKSLWGLVHHGLFWYVISLYELTEKFEIEGVGVGVGATFTHGLRLWTNETEVIG